MHDLSSCHGLIPFCMPQTCTLQPVCGITCASQALLERARISSAPSTPNGAPVPRPPTPSPPVGDLFRCCQRKRSAAPAAVACCACVPGAVGAAWLGPCLLSIMPAVLSQPPQVTPEPWPAALCGRVRVAVQLMSVRMQSSAGQEGWVQGSLAERVVIVAAGQSLKTIIVCMHPPTV